MAHTASADEARARFAAATAAHLEGRLTDDVTLETTDAAGWEQHSKRMWEGGYDRAPALDLRVLMSDDERARGDDLQALAPPSLEHRVLLKAGDEVIGAYWGLQESFLRYYMVSSVVAAGWRRRGLYKALLPRVIAAATDAGFREIYSRHVADNNPIIIPKLQAGFAISAFEVAPRFGLLVHLRYYPSAAMRQLAGYRVDGSYAPALRAAGLPVP